MPTLVVTKFYNFHNLLTLQIKRDSRSLFDYYLDSVFAHYEVSSQEKPDLVISIGGEAPIKKNCFWIDGKYAVSENSIYYRNQYKAARWGIEIRGLESEQTTVWIHGNRFARPVLAGETLYSLLRFKLARKGYTMVHASGVGVGSGGFFFAARGGVGKTITALHAVRRGAVLFGDDTVIVGPQGKMFSFAVPFNLRFTYDVERLMGIRFPWRLRLELALKKLLARLTFGRYRLFTVLSPGEVFPQSIGKEIPLCGAFILVQASPFEIVREESQEMFFSRLLQIVQFESPELTAMLRAYAHIFPGSSVGRFWEEFRRVLTQNLVGIPSFRVSLPRHYETKYFETFWEEMNSCRTSATTSTI